MPVSGWKNVNPRDPHCMFCGKGAIFGDHNATDRVARVIVGDDVAICNECVELCNQILRDDQRLMLPGDIGI